MTNSTNRKRNEASWTFLTNHAHVLLCLAQDPEALLRDVAARVGITERAVQRIIAELEGAGYLEREREGRCNRYHIRDGQPLRHPIECHRSVAALIALGEPGKPARRAQARQRRIKRRASA
jgi:hypothetical protein